MISGRCQPLARYALQGSSYCYPVPKDSTSGSPFPRLLGKQNSHLKRKFADNGLYETAPIILPDSAVHE